MLGWGVHCLCACLHLALLLAQCRVLQVLAAGRCKRQDVYAVAPPSSLLPTSASTVAGLMGVKLPDDEDRGGDVDGGQP